MTETTIETKPHNAKDILAEALATIEATYWIQSSEVTFVTAGLDDGAYIFSGWDDVEKSVLVDLDEDTFRPENSRLFANPAADNKAKVTGVCSIGALALANVTLYDEPLTSWISVYDRDFETKKASEALSQVLLAQEPYLLDNNNAGDIIASWNDADGRTREQVIDAFTEALASPLLGADTIYQLGISAGWGTPTMPLFFATEAEGQAFLATESPLRKQVYNVWKAESDFIFVEHTNEVLSHA